MRPACNRVGRHLLSQGGAADGLKKGVDRQRPFADNTHRSRHRRLTGSGRPIARPIYGAIAQLGERLLCTQEVSGSIPLGSTIILDKSLKAQK